MRRRALCVAGALAIGWGAAGCPRLPPPPPRPSVVLERLDRAAAAGAGGMWLRARLRVHNRGAAALTVAAVDWELVLETRPLLRGRAHAHRLLAPDQRAAIDVSIAVPAPLEAELRSGAAPDQGRIRLRGTVHLEDPSGLGRPAPFDEAAALP